jgi:hypothetical protein
MRRMDILIAVASALASIGIISCGRPPLRVTQQQRAVIIDMQSLGEYPSDVARLRVIDAARDEVVWEVKGRDEPQLGRVQLIVGENPAQITDVRHGKYEVVTPAGKSTFTLAPGVRYVVEAWVSESRSGSKRTAEFTLMQ